VSGSITQSELKAKLEAKKAAETDPEKAALIDVNRELTLADLSIGDLTASIAIEMPKKWDERFKSKATFKRVTKATTEVAEGNEDDPDDNTQGGSSDNTQSGGTDNTQGGDQGGGNSSITPGEGD
jgi:hypothetical protein